MPALVPVISRGNAPRLMAGTVPRDKPRIINVVAQRCYKYYLCSLCYFLCESVAYFSVRALCVCACFGAVARDLGGTLPGEVGHQGGADAADPADQDAAELIDATDRCLDRSPRARS